MSTPIPIDINLLQKLKVLEVRFEDGAFFALPCSLLRLHSPSAETPISQEQAENVNITSIEPVGNYAIKLFFDDGHQTGLYSWQTLYHLGQQLGKTS